MLSASLNKTFLSLSRPFQHVGRIDFSFTMLEIRELANKVIGGRSMVDSELEFHVNVSDWYSGLNRTGWATTIVVSSRVKLRWIGGGVRTFKPNSNLKVAVRIKIQRCFNSSVKIHRLFNASVDWRQSVHL